MKGKYNIFTFSFCEKVVKNIVVVKMVDFSKVVERLKKKIPEITDDEISEIISTIPTNMPTPLVNVLIDTLAICHKNPDKLKKLQSTDAKSVLSKMSKK